MTKKTYIELAKQLGILIADQHGVTEPSIWRVMDVVCDALKQDNSAFDKERFIEAIKDQRDKTTKRYDDAALQNLTNMIVLGNGS
jgi:hypothetical protein